MVNEHESRQVVDGVAEVLNNGRIPMFLPHKYRPPLQELAEARDERTWGRKQKFERAVKNLQPVLDAAWASGLKGPYIDRLLAQWRMVCSFGPAPLPTPKLHEKFEFTYVAQGGETVTEVARKFGYDNPGPLCHPAYGYSPHMRLKKGDKLFVPVAPRILKCWIVASVKLIEKAFERLDESFERVHAAKEDLERTLLIVEAIQIVLNILKAAVKGVELGAKAVSSLTSSAAAKEVSKEAIELLCHDAGHTSGELLNMILENVQTPKKGLSFYLHHTLGLLSVNYWASMYTMFKRGEPEIYLYGPGGTSSNAARSLHSE